MKHRRRASSRNLLCTADLASAAVCAHATVVTGEFAQTGGNNWIANFKLTNVQRVG